MKKKQTIILIVVASAALVIALGTISNFLIRNRLAQNLFHEYQERERLVADEVARNLEQNLQGVQDKLNLIATMPEVRDGNTAVCNQRLSEVFAVMEAKVGNLGRVGADGNFRCSLNKSLIGLKGENLGPYIKEIFDDPEHKPVLSRAILPPGADSYVSAVHVPVYDTQQRFIGTLGGAVYFKELREKYLKNITFADNGFVVLIDDNGDILFHPEFSLIGKNLDNPHVQTILGGSPEFKQAMEAAKSGESGNVRYTVGEDTHIAVFRPADILPGHHWTVLVTVPSQDAATELARVGVNDAFIWFTVVLSLAVAMVAAMMLVNLLKSYELQQTKDEFVSLASHQLRTPATAVMDYIELVLDGVAGKITAKQRELLQTARDSNQRQIGIINELLNVARVDAERIVLNRARTDLVALTKKVAEEQSVAISGRHQKIHVAGAQPKVEALVDPTYIRMVIDNLINNASKYTHKGGQITVHLENRDGQTVLSVKDTGVGIAQRDISKLFGKLSRIKNELSDEVGGTGLGLYLVKKLVELHGGRVDVQSTAGKGTTFIVTLPAVTAQQGKPPGAGKQKT